MPEKTLSLLRSHAELIERNKEQIAQDWMQDGGVLKVFKRFDIPKTPFVTNFGMPIIDYFIGVISGKEKPGDCPIMTRLVKYLITKHIAPKEVFIICMGLRRELMGMLLGHETDRERLRGLMMETSRLFNANLAGVLELFEHHLTQSREQLDSLSQDLRAYELLAGLVSSTDACIGVLRNNELVFANAPFLARFGLDDSEAFNLAYCEAEKTWSFVSSCSFGQDLIEAGNYSEWAAQLAESQAPCLMRAELPEGLVELSVASRAIHEHEHVLTLIDIGHHLAEADEALEKVKADEEAMKERIAELAKSTLPEASKTDGSGLVAPESFEQDIRLQQVRKSGQDFVVMLVATDPETLEKSQGGLLRELKPILPAEAILSQIDPTLFAVCWQRRDRNSLMENFLKIETAITALNLKAALTLFKETVHPKRAVVACMDLLDHLGKEETLATDIDEVIDARAAIRDHEMIFEALGNLTEIETTVFHQQVPVTASNNLLSLKDQDMQLDMTPKQANTVQAGMYIHFELEGIGFVKGMCDRVDRKNRKMVITDICTNANSPLLRKSIRVKALPGMTATLVKGDTRLEAEMLDCAQHSVGLKLTKLRDMKLGDKVEFFAVFPLRDNEKEQISTTATITKVIKKDGFIIVCDFGSHPGAGSVLRQFASFRQLDVVRDIGGGKKTKG